MEDFKENVTKIKNFKQAVDELTIPAEIKKQCEKHEEEIK